jgi:hypothetical protein
VGPNAARNFSVVVIFWREGWAVPARLTSHALEVMAVAEVA